MVAAPGPPFVLGELHVVAPLLLAGDQWKRVPDQELTFPLIPRPRPWSGIPVTFNRRPVQGADGRGERTGRRAPTAATRGWATKELARQRMGVAHGARHMTVRRSLYG